MLVPGLVSSMATPFFPLTPQGLGTEDVEALDSYILRLATEHGVTEYQFHRLLANWWNGIRSAKQYELGRHVGYISKVGYGKDVDTLVQALERGTGQEGLSSLTLSAFRDVCGTHVGCQSNHVHYWCPACIKDQIQESSPIYEKLAWRLKAISRCRSHKLALQCECPWCGRHQLRHVDTWPNCSECGQSLIAKEHLWRPSFCPSDGESDMLDVIAYCAANPGTVFQRDAARHFWELIRDDKNVGSRLTTQYFHRKVPDRTLISVLLRFAREVKIPLLSILLDPGQAATIRPLPIDESISVSVGQVPQRVRRLSIAQRKALGKALQSYLRSSKKYQSLKQLCSPFPCTVGAARYWYPELVQAVVEHNRKLWRVASDSQGQALERLRIDLSLVSKAEEVGWHKVEGDLAKQCHVPLHRVRKRLLNLKRARSPSQ